MERGRSVDCGTRACHRSLNGTSSDKHDIEAGTWRDPNIRASHLRRSVACGSSLQRESSLRGSGAAGRDRAGGEAARRRAQCRYGSANGKLQFAWSLNAYFYPPSFETLAWVLEVADGRLQDLWCRDGLNRDMELLSHLIEREILMDVDKVRSDAQGER